MFLKSALKAYVSIFLILFFSFIKKGTPHLTSQFYKDELDPNFKMRNENKSNWHHKQF